MHPADPSMIYRLGTKADIPAMVRLRKTQLVDEGFPMEDCADQAMTDFFTNGLADGSLVEWLLEDDGKIVATGAVTFLQFPPNFQDIAGKRAYFCNIYTHPDYRGRGIATQMLTRLQAEANSRNIHHIYITASKMGRPVYLKYGFTPLDTWLQHLD